MINNSISRTVIALYDDKIQYLTLSKNNYGFYVQNYDSAELEEGIIKNGEVLRVDFLKKILSKISKKIDTKNIDLILPHDYFLFDLHSIEKKGKKSNEKILKAYLKDEKTKIKWAKTHSYEYDIFERDNILKVLFRGLPHDIYHSYEYVFKKSGFKIKSIQSEIVSFSSILPQDKRVSQIFVKKNCSHLLEYKEGIYVSDKKFNLSYKQFTQDIKKNINISEEEAKKILSQYGVLKAHKDKKVLTRIERSLNPLYDFLRKRKIKEKSSIYIHFSNEPIKGFSDRIKRFLKIDIYDMCVLKSDYYSFQDVLTLHKNESYQYEPLIARALSFFDKSALR